VQKPPELFGIYQFPLHRSGGFLGFISFVESFVIRMFVQKIRDDPCTKVLLLLQGGG
jgi:hypothetical protein